MGMVALNLAGYRSIGTLAWTVGLTVGTASISARAADPIEPGDGTRVFVEERGELGTSSPRMRARRVTMKIHELRRSEHGDEPVLSMGTLAGRASAGLGGMVFEVPVFETIRARVARESSFRRAAAPNVGELESTTAERNSVPDFVSDDDPLSGSATLRLLRDR